MPASGMNASHANEYIAPQEILEALLLEHTKIAVRLKRFHLPFPEMHDAPFGWSGAAAFHCLFAICESLYSMLCISRLLKLYPASVVLSVHNRNCYCPIMDSVKL